MIKINNELPVKYHHVGNVLIVRMLACSQCYMGVFNSSAAQSTNTGIQGLARLPSKAI